MFVGASPLESERDVRISIPSYMFSSAFMSSTNSGSELTGDQYGLIHGDQTSTIPELKVADAIMDIERILCT